ncbi:Lantibiotic protection ABC transporter permease subunit, MutE/EpiE family [[Clostridium] ultunense Esp]|uniref:lantibiotic immunity ABC transporter MutE/EpiE family permease subunit n=1 Tax=Thermicanus aegyptius TaxID=94009 RepID=UPI0002B6F9B5|nr:lantibiotic immunity ABC transporter MutE/EpiE family permease subunit [Thermicanus aegyptius]CCQ97695.1 Lantibiotic protection ABC transporter permease subunit, MutE/EpiE family [[Clostridium] ultunense Esp]
MMKILRAESVKYRRTFTRRLVFFAPLFFILIALLQKLFMPVNYLKPWRLLLVQAYNWWPVLFIPLGIALFAVLVASQEKRAGNYRNVKVHPLSPSLIWAGKMIMMAFHTLLATLVLIAAVLISGLITAEGEVPWTEVFAGGFILWVTSLVLIPIQLWAATWKGTLLSMGVGLIGMIAGVVAAPETYWIYVPWSWPTRLMAPIIGVHPNGVPLEASDPLRDPSAIPIGIGLSLAAFILFTLMTSMWFHRREIR